MQQEQRQLGIKSANELVQESWQEKTKLPVKTLDEIVREYEVYKTIGESYKKVKKKE